MSGDKIHVVTVGWSMISKVQSCRDPYHASNLAKNVQDLRYTCKARHSQHKFGESVKVCTYIEAASHVQLIGLGKSHTLFIRQNLFSSGQRHTSCSVEVYAHGTNCFLKLSATHRQNCWSIIYISTADPF